MVGDGRGVRSRSLVGLLRCSAVLSGLDGWRGPEADPGDTQIPAQVSTYCGLGRGDVPVKAEGWWCDLTFWAAWGVGRLIILSL